MGENKIILNVSNWKVIQIDTEKLPWGKLTRSKF